MTTTLDQAVHKIEEAFHSLEKDVEGFVKEKVKPAVDAEFSALGTQVLGLGETVLSQVWTAAGAWLLSGGPLNPGSSAAAISSVVAQLPRDLKALEHLVAASFAGAVQRLQAQAIANSAPKL